MENFQEPAGNKWTFSAWCLLEETICGTDGGNGSTAKPGQARVTHSRNREGGLGGWELLWLGWLRVFGGFVLVSLDWGLVWFCLGLVCLGVCWLFGLGLFGCFSIFSFQIMPLGFVSVLPDHFSSETTLKSLQQHQDQHSSLFSLISLL